MEDKSNRKNQFLITGFPRSGTQYISRCLRRFGYGIGEEIDYPHSHGVVGWTHTPFAKDFKTVALQLRHPLKVISSAQTIDLDVWYKLTSRHIGTPKGKLTPLTMAIYAYPKWFDMAEKYAGIVYRVEDVGKIYKDLMGYLGLQPPLEWTRGVPLNQNTRSGMYKNIQWEDIKKIDPKNYKLIEKIAKLYHYI